MAVSKPHGLNAHRHAPEASAANAAGTTARMAHGTRLERRLLCELLF